MKKVLSIIFIIVGLVLVGYGSFNFFEKYDDYLSTQITSAYTGIYKFGDDLAVVSAVDDKKIEITFNNESYDFYYSNGSFENEPVGLLANFKGDSLIISKDGEELKTYHKQKK